MMNTAVNKPETSSDNTGIVYRTVCQNPGCGFIFDLRITPKNAGLLGGTIACARCRRHGGMLKPTGRLGDKLYSAKLVFKAANIGYISRNEDEGDLFSEMGLSDY
ncbi:MAG: hypothetical protein WA005_18500 [Candidatus Binataceae bacterium]